MLIRDADDGDWPAIWPFFREIVDAGETYAYPEDLTFAEAQRLWMPPRADATTGATRHPSGRTVVALVDDVVAGSATMGPNRPGRGSHIATASFMVAPHARGSGVGRALGDHVVSWARDEGYEGIQFNAVVETNTAAVALWSSLGFRVMTTIPGAFRHRTAGRVGLHVMFRSLP